MQNLKSWTMRQSRSVGALALCALTTLATSTAALAQPQQAEAQDIAITMTPLAWPVGHQRMGALSYAGGWALTSEDPRFGGLSGLELRGEKGFAVSDRGVWLTFSFERGADGVMRGLRRAQIGPLRDAARQPLTGRSADAEALAVTPGGLLAIGFEGGHRIQHHAVIDGEAQAESIAPAFDLLPRNGGLEALATAPDGGLIAIAEESPRDGRPKDAASGLALPRTRDETGGANPVSSATPRPFRPHRRGFWP